jgi:hypothetical protein
MNAEQNPSIPIREFDALEIHPCVVVGHDDRYNEIVEQSLPAIADFWTVYGRYHTGRVEAIEDFASPAEARAFHDRLVSIYPHLAAGVDEIARLPVIDK